MGSTPTVLLLPDAGPLITLAYADALDLLLKPGWQVQIVDMVRHEVTRSQTPTSHAISEWIAHHDLTIIPTRTLSHYKELESASPSARKAHLGELAIQEAMNEMALASPAPTGVFLFEDHKIARASFLVPPNCRKISTRAFLLFLEQKGWLASAAEIERKAIMQGRHFSQLRFPAE